MILASTVIMYGLMYLNSYELGHVFFSETRTWMAIIMLAFMLGMYKKTKINIAIFVGAAVVFAGSLFLVRSQNTIADEAWMSAMIPHHSTAILTSERVNIEDQGVRELADEIIKAQRREIDEMKWFLEDIEANGHATSEAEANASPVLDFEGEL